MVAGAGALSQKGFAVPDDDVSLGELSRRIEAMRREITGDIHDLAKRLDAKVSMERHELERQAHEKDVREVAARVARLEQDRKEERNARTADRKWVIAAFVAPTVVVIVGISLQVILTVMGLL